MDLLNNLVFASRNNTYAATTDNTRFDPIKPDFVSLPGNLLPTPLAPTKRGLYYAYNIDQIKEFCAVEDSDFIEKAIQKHWADIVYGRSYTSSDTDGTSGPKPPPNPPPDNDATIYYSRFRAVPPSKLPLSEGSLLPPYHLIYSYLVENTRCVQIIGKLLYMYMHDEKLNKATTSANRLAFQWMVNTEDLFYKNLSNTSYRNLSSEVRISPDLTRRNAYFRMFGIDLAFGDASNNPALYYKAELNNQPFIMLFEKFLTEVWQAYTNASNSAGTNSTDMFIIVDTAQKIQEMLMSRRTTEGNFNNYRYFNLSREEYASAVMMSWIYEIVSYDSPIVQFLNCNGNTPGERLINIGSKVGLPAHSKSEGLLDIAPAMNTLLRRIEYGEYNNQTHVDDIIKSQKDKLPEETSPIRQALTDLLLIINNWEKATGHKIKNPEAQITGTVKVQQNGAKVQPVMN